MDTFCYGTLHYDLTKYRLEIYSRSVRSSTALGSVIDTRRLKIHRNNRGYCVYSTSFRHCSKREENKEYSEKRCFLASKCEVSRLAYWAPECPQSHQRELGSTGGLSQVDSRFPSNEESSEI